MNCVIMINLRFSDSFDDLACLYHDIRWDANKWKITMNLMLVSA